MWQTTTPIIWSINWGIPYNMSIRAAVTPRYNPWIRRPEPIQKFLFKLILPEIEYGMYSSSARRRQFISETQEFSTRMILDYPLKFNNFRASMLSRTLSPSCQPRIDLVSTDIHRSRPGLCKNLIFQYCLLSGCMRYHRCFQFLEHNCFSSIAMKAMHGI